MHEMRFMFLTSANKQVTSLLALKYAPNQESRFIFFYHILSHLGFLGTQADLMSCALIPVGSGLIT